MDDLEVDRQDIDDILKHFGVPGMRWGHRKGRSARPMSKTQAKLNLEKAVIKDNKTQRRLATGLAAVVAMQAVKMVAPRRTVKIATAGLVGAAAVNSIMKVHGAERLVQLKS